MPPSVLGFSKRARSSTPHAGKAKPSGAGVRSHALATAAISIAGISGNQFSFLGFVPSKKGRETFFTDLELYDHPVVFLEATHRILKTLESLATLYPKSTVYLGRELTKIYEEMLVGTPTEVLDILVKNAVKQKGEFVIILSQS